MKDWNSILLLNGENCSHVTIMYFVCSLCLAFYLCDCSQASKFSKVVFIYEDYQEQIM